MEGSTDSGSERKIAIAAGKSVVTDVTTTDPFEELFASAAGKSEAADVTIQDSFENWKAFLEFLRNREPPRSLSKCTADDAVEFLLYFPSDKIEAIVGSLTSGTFERVLGRHKENPFGSAIVRSFLKERVEEKTGQEEYGEKKLNFLSVPEGYKSEIMGWHHDNKVNLFEKYLTASDVCNLNRFVVTTNEEAREYFLLATIPGDTDNLLRLEDEEGRLWLFGFSYLNISQSYEVTKGWSSYVKENQLGAGDCVFIQPNRTDSSRLFIGCRRRNNDALLGPLERIFPLLDCPQPSSPQIVGLWGMAGIGKTTIAREIFRTQAERYDLCYFLPDFHKMCQTRGLNHLRGEFLSKIFGEKVYIDACDTELSFTRDTLLDKRVLVILDGVSNARDAEVLVGGFGWFSGGHTIIFTSRNRQVLVQCEAKELYEIPKLSEAESFQLRCQYATENIWTGNMTLISELAKYACGIPLALQVLFSSTQMQFIHNEKEHLKRLRQHPPIEFQDAFRGSFNGLDENDKNIFLDLACFFRGEIKDHVVNILDGCGLFTKLGICGLIDESLISLVENRIEMPDIFQDTGRFVVCQENKEASKRSRLWNSCDISHVLMSNSGTEAIECIFLDVFGLTLELSPTVFERMYRLRLLKFYCPTSENHSKLCLPEGLHSLPDELRLLHWERYPLVSLPRNFNPKNLVELNMPYSNMKKLWKGTKNLEKLKRIILSHSRQLKKFPRLSKAMNLEHIDLEGCTSLVKVNSSILHHHKLTFLSLKDCSHLKIMPTTIHLESLEVLNLSGCSELEDLHDFSPNLKELYLAGTAIREMPSSIGNLTRLVTLDLENCDKLQHLPPEISKLKAMVTLSTKRPASSIETKDILRVIPSATNLSEVQLDTCTSVNDPSSTGFNVLPERPSQVECLFYRKGYCIRGDACRFQHTRNRETSVPDSSLSSIDVSSSVGASSKSELVQASTKKPRIDTLGFSLSLGNSSSELVQASTASEITQATVGRD